MIKKKVNLRRAELVSNVENIDLEFINYQLSISTYIKDYAYIVHDQDTVKDSDEPRLPHLHLIMRFNTPKSLTTIANKFKVGEQFIQKIEGSWTSVCRYLIHANHPEKYQYPASQITANFDYEKTIAITDEGKDNRKKISKKKVDTRKYEIINLVENGTIKRYNHHEYLTALEYEKYSPTLERQWKRRDDKMMYRLRDRAMDVIYIFGRSGTGKTTLAKRLARKKGYSTVISGGGPNLFDTYCGQDCLILDDLRPSVFLNRGKHNSSDLLKLLDNHTASTVRARYHDRSLGECKLVIITSILKPTNFWNELDPCIPGNDRDEPIEQFYRRLSCILKVTRDKITPFVYDEIEGKPLEGKSQSNNLLKDIQQQSAKEKLKRFETEYMNAVLV